MVARKRIKPPPAKAREEVGPSRDARAEAVFPAAPIPQRSMVGIPPIEKAEVLALQSLAAGKANSNQQIMALKLIVESFADYGGVCINPQEALAHAGRRFVGVCIVQTLIKE